MAGLSAQEDVCPCLRNSIGLFWQVRAERLLCARASVPLYSQLVWLVVQVRSEMAGPSAREDICSCFHIPIGSFCSSELRWKASLRESKLNHAPISTTRLVIGLLYRSDPRWQASQHDGTCFIVSTPQLAYLGRSELRWQAYPTPEDVCPSILSSIALCSSELRWHASHYEKNPSPVVDQKVDFASSPVVVIPDVSDVLGDASPKLEFANLYAGCQSVLNKTPSGFCRTHHLADVLQQIRGQYVWHHRSQHSAGCFDSKIYSTNLKNDRFLRRRTRLLCDKSGISFPETE
jgi:hypothetical protein